MMFDETKQYRVYLCGGARCGPHSQPVLLDTLELALWDHELDDKVELRVSGCQSRCSDGPNLMIYPGPYYYTHLTRAAIEQIVEQHLGQDQPVQTLLDQSAPLP